MRATLVFNGLTDIMLTYVNYDKHVTNYYDHFEKVLVELSVTVKKRNSGTVKRSSFVLHLDTLQHSLSRS